MTTFTDTDPLTDAVVAALEADNLTVGDGTAQGLTAPYVVVYHIEGGTLDGTLANPDEDAQAVYQTTSVNHAEGQPQAVRKGAQIVRDRVRAVMLDRTNITVPGYTTQRVVLAQEGGTRPDPDDETHTTFTAVDRFRIWLTPTT